LIGKGIDLDEKQGVNSNNLFRDDIVNLRRKSLKFAP
jgi:hypothetical protein